MADAAAKLLAAHAALPEPYQPAWGLDESRGVARRGCDDRVAIILPLLESLPGDGPLRILDLGCAQGYFTLAIAHALTVRGREFEVVGVDYLEDNVRFCMALAAYHGITAKFLHERFDASFFKRHAWGKWDGVLALNVLHHLQQQRDNVVEVVNALRAHSKVALCELAQRQELLEWVDNWHEDDDDVLGGYTFRRRLASLSTHLTEIPRPLYVCSDTLAWVGERWFAFDRVADRSHPGVPDAFAGQRKFFFGRDVIIKAYRGDGRYGAFNRAELEAEAITLVALADASGRYPRILGQADDGNAVWLARGLLGGQLLSACIDAGETCDRDAVVRGLLGELARLEARGFHHGDLRCWNVLVDEGEVRLIDFGAMTREHSSLHRVALAAILLEIADGKLRHEQPFYASLHPLSAYPRAWHGLLRYVLETSLEEFRYEHALTALETVEHGIRVASVTPAEDVLAAAAQEQADGFRRLQEHVVETERRLVLAEQNLVDAATDRAALESSRGEAETHAHSLAKALARSEAYASSLKAALEVSQRYAESLQAALQQERIDLTARIGHWQGRHARLQRRFRLLKFLWPHESDSPKELE